MPVQAGAEGRVAAAYLDSACRFRCSTRRHQGPDSVLRRLGVCARRTVAATAVLHCVAADAAHLSRFYHAARSPATAGHYGYANAAQRCAICRY